MVYFEGTLEEAVLESGRANSQAKLQMDNRERQDFAWRLVRMGYKKKDIATAAGVSDGQVGIMRRVRRQLGDTADDHPIWYRAHKAAQGMSHQEMTDAEREAWVEGQTQDFADRMAKEFGSKLSNNIEIAAGALAIYFGRRLPELVSDLAAYVPSEDDDGTPDDF